MTLISKLAAQCSRANIEVFHVNGAMARTYTTIAKTEDTRMVNKGERCYAGWYWWSCAPGCIPDSDNANGPFTSETAAMQDALGDTV